MNYKDIYKCEQCQDFAELLTVLAKKLSDNGIQIEIKEWRDKKELKKHMNNPNKFPLPETHREINVIKT